MRYYIVQKQDIQSGELVYTNFGYVDTLEDKEYIEDNWQAAFIHFIKLNIKGLDSGDIDIKEFFNDKPYSYVVDIELSTIEGLELDKINVNNL